MERDLHLMRVAFLGWGVVAMIWPNVGRLLLLAFGVYYACAS